MCINIPRGFNSTAGIVVLMLNVMLVIVSTTLITLSVLIEYYHAAQTPSPIVTSIVDRITISTAALSSISGVVLFLVIVCKRSHRFLCRTTTLHSFLGILSLLVGIMSFMVFNGFCPPVKAVPSRCVTVYVYLKVIGSLLIVNTIIHAVIHQTVKATTAYRFPRVLGEETALLRQGRNTLNRSPNVAGPSTSSSSAPQIVVTSQDQPSTSSSSAPLIVTSQDQPSISSSSAPPIVTSQDQPSTSFSSAPLIVTSQGQPSTSYSSAPLIVTIHDEPSTSPSSAALTVTSQGQPSTSSSSDLVIAVTSASQPSTSSSLDAVINVTSQSQTSTSSKSASIIYVTSESSPTMAPNSAPVVGTPTEMEIPTRPKSASELDKPSEI